MSSLWQWWTSISPHVLWLVVIVVQVVILAHHWVVIVLKLRIRRETRHYLQAAEQEQVTASGVLVELKRAMSMVVEWAELARINTTTARQFGGELGRKMEEATGQLEQRIDAVPDKVVEKIDESSSGIYKKHPPAV